MTPTYEPAGDLSTLSQPHIGLRSKGGACFGSVRGSKNLSHACTRQWYSPSSRTEGHRPRFRSRNDPRTFGQTSSLSTTVVETMLARPRPSKCPSGPERLPSLMQGRSTRLKVLVQSLARAHGEIPYSASATPESGRRDVEAAGNSSRDDASWERQESAWTQRGVARVELGNCSSVFVSLVARVSADSAPG